MTQKNAFLRAQEVRKMPHAKKDAEQSGKTTAAQKRATENYRARKGGAQNVQKTIGSTYSRQEGERIAAAYTAAGITAAQAMRAIAATIEGAEDAATIGAAIKATAERYAAENATHREAARTQTNAQNAAQTDADSSNA